VTEARSLEAIVSGLGFVDELQEGLWVADSHGTIVLANRALATLVGLDSPKQMVGRFWQELFPSAEAGRLGGLQPSGDFPTATDTIILDRDRRQIGVSLALARKKVEGVAWYLGTVVPSPAARQPGVASTGQQVMENSVDGICIIEQGRIVYVNRRFEEMTGYTTSQLGRLGLDRLVVSRDRNSVARLVTEPEKVTGPVNLEVRIIARSGQEMDTELHIVPTASNSHTSLLCFLRDVSRLRRAEQTGTDFIATVSHEIRTPLAAIREAMALLSESGGAQLGDRERRYLAIAREEIDRLNRMVDNLIQVSRMESGKETLNLMPVELSSVIRGSLASLSLFVTKKKLEVSTELPAGLPPVLADKDRLLQVFNNLLDNSIKYTPAGSTIRISAEVVPPDAPVLSESDLLSNTRYVQVTISDSGPGIPAEFLDRIFGRFERVDPHGPGIGLGLSIVRSIVEMHHGKVWALSTLGEGASFSFVLPLGDNA